LEAEYQVLRAQGQYKGDEASGRKAFYDRQVVWRSRVRGVKGTKAAVVSDPRYADAEGEVEGEVEAGVDQVTGQRIYLPNIQIRLMRNHTPAGEAYDPNVATFRIPHNMTKTDLRSYLSALYGMTVTFIRTDNYFPAVKRMPGGGQLRVPVGSLKSYKRAIVGLTEPFHYPDDVDELYAQGEKMGLGTQLGDERKEWIETNFQVGMLGEMKKKALMKFHKGYRWRSKTHDNPVRLWFHLTLADISH
jgi:large subunit ribosomal protein L23